MIEFLKLCGFEEDEIESELPRVEKAFQKLGLSTEDVEEAKRRLIKYYDVELKGIRKALRLCVKESVNSLLIEEDGKKAVIYGVMIPGIDTIGAAMLQKSADVFSIHQSYATHLVVGCILGKLVPIMEEAEKLWLKAGMVAQCGNVKTLLGGISLGLYAKPDLMVTAGYSCEIAPKTIDLLNAVYDIPAFCIDNCHDRSLINYVKDTERGAELAAKSMRTMVKRIEEIAGFAITDDMLREMLDAKNKVVQAMQKVKGLVETSDPIPLSPTHENIWLTLNSLTLDLNGYAEALNAVNLIYEELQERVAQGQGATEKGAPRVLAILPPGEGDPRMEHLATELGIAIVAVNTSYSVPFDTKTDDPYLKLSFVMQNSTLGTNLAKKIELIINACRRLKVDGVLNRYHVGCRQVAGDCMLIEKAIKEELNIPTLLWEWENFDPREYQHDEYKRRFEIFKTMITAKSS